MQPQKLLKCLMVVGVSVCSLHILESCKKRQSSKFASSETSDPYLFVGGACQTSGRWVEAAIKQAQKIKTVITSLRDDPKCTAMVNNMDQLFATTEEVDSGPGEDPKGTVAQMFGISREITALSQYRRARTRANEGAGGDESNANVDKIMTDRMFQMLGLNNDVADARDSSPDGSPVPRSAAFNEANQVVDQVINMKARALRTASAGLDIAARVFNNLADDGQCLVGRTPAVGTIAIAGAKLLGAYVGSDSGLSIKAGSAIAAYFKFLKDQKFNKAIMGINEAEFLLSISCLMETTSANYCAVRDAQYLQEDLMAKGIGLRTYWKPEEQQPDMMTGFKVLNQDVPVVADWLRKVVTGVTPRRRADADYYNSVMGSLNGLQQILTTAQTAIQETKYNLPKEDLQQRKSVYDLAQKLREIFQSSGEKLDSSRTGALPDFYGMASPEVKQLFDILGMDLPRDCDSSILTFATGLKEPTIYLEAGGKYDKFGSPVAVLERMDTNVKIIFDRMSMLVTAYVRNNLNIDQPNVATDFVAPSASGNALTRIQQIRSYLVSLCIRISNAVKNNTARAEDKSFARLFMDTILRIDRVLDAQQKILDDFEQFRPEFDNFIENEKKRKVINLSGEGEGSSDVVKQLRQKFENRYNGKGATEEDKNLMAALQLVFPGDETTAENRLDRWFINEAAAMEHGRLKATKIENRKLRGIGGTSLSLEGSAGGEGVSTDKLDTGIYGVLLNAAFDQFDMLRFREGFFINRVAKAVYWDISKQLVEMQRDYNAAQQNPALMGKYKERWSNVSQRLLVMADNFVIDKINNLVPKDLQASMLDQSKAVVLNQANLSAMTVFQDPLIKQISRLQSLQRGVTSDWQIQKDLIHNTIWNPLRPFGYATDPENDAIMKRAFGRAGASGSTGFLNVDADRFDSLAGVIGRWVRPDLYWSPYFWTDKTHFQDDEFGSLKTFRGLLCMQTLAYPDPTPFREVCKGAVLQSVFEKNGPVDNRGSGYVNPDSLSMSYDDWMEVYDVYKGKNSLDARKFQGRRICAVNDHLRNNSIHMIKLRNRSDAEVFAQMQANQK